VQFVNPVFGCVVVTADCALRRQLGPALGTAALKNESPGFRCHTSAETVGAGALYFAGLKSAFHDYYLDQ